MTITVWWNMLPENIAEREAIEQKWQYLKTIAGCNDLKHEMDQILIKEHKDRTLQERDMLEYLKERYSWTCSPEARGISD